MIMSIIHHNFWAFLSSVDEISKRNCSSGMEMNMSLSSPGMSKSSRTYKTSSVYRVRLFFFFPLKEMFEMNLYLENSFNLSATNQKSGTCAFTFEKYFQHLIVISYIILRLKEVKVIQYGQQNTQL
jgi:hypothetical protein